DAEYQDDEAQPENDPQRDQQDGEIGRNHGADDGSETRPSRTSTSPSRASAAIASASSGCPPSTTARRANARRWRNEPSNGPCRRSGSKRRPRDGDAPASGEASHRRIPGPENRLAEGNKGSGA